MVSGFQDLDFVIVGSVHKPMFVVDPPRPVLRQFSFERFWFSNPRERVALYFSDESSDSTEAANAAGLSPEVVTAVEEEREIPQDAVELIETLIAHLSVH